MSGVTDEPPPYAELSCRSNFTFLVGASQPEELVERAASELYIALALTGECTLSGVVRAHLEARGCGLHFIVGSEILFSTSAGTSIIRLLLLAQDRRGYGNLSELIALARRCTEKGSYQALVADVECKSSKLPHLAEMPERVHGTGDPVAAGPVVRSEVWERGSHALEELIAELGSAFVMVHVGLVGATIERSCGLSRALDVDVQAGSDGGLCRGTDCRAGLRVHHGVAR